MLGVTLTLSVSQQGSNILIKPKVGHLNMLRLARARARSTEGTVHNVRKTDIGKQNQSHLSPCEHTHI